VEREVCIRIVIRVTSAQLQKFETLVCAMAFGEIWHQGGPVRGSAPEASTRTTSRVPLEARPTVTAFSGEQIVEHPEVAGVEGMSEGNNSLPHLAGLTVPKPARLRRAGVRRRGRKGRDAKTEHRAAYWHLASVQLGSILRLRSSSISYG
jgi:hypothetical protein